MAHHVRNIFKNSRAFTLIEMMLVLAIMSILIVGGLNAMQAHYEKERIKKTATDMREWLQAGLNYYQKTETWPTTAALISAGYFEASMQTNPWGNPYNLTNNQAKSLCTTAEPMQKTGVTNILITTDTNTTGQARELSLLLPLSSVGVDTGNGNKPCVTAQVIPSEQAQSSIHQIGWVSPGALVEQPICSAGYVPVIFPSLQNTGNNKSSQGIQSIKIIPKAIIQNNTNYWRVDLSINDKPVTSSDTQIEILTTCQKGVPA